MSDTVPGGPDLGRLTRAGTAIANLAKAFRLQGAINEDRDKLSLEAPLDAKTLADVPPVAGELANLESTFGAKIKVGDLLILTITQATKEADVKSVQKDLEGQEVRVDLSVDKNALLKELGFIHPDSEVALFLTAAGLVQQLGAPLPELEKSVLRWQEDAHKLIIIVAGSQVLMTGEHFAILGSEAANGWASVVPRHKPSDSGILALRNQAFQSPTGPGTVNWFRFELKKLTPVHLVLESTEGDDDSSKLVRRALFRVQGLLSIVYTATQVTAPEGGPGGETRDWMAIYAAEGQIARVSWNGSGSPAAGLQDDVFEKGAASLGKIAEWAYSGERPSADRLTVVRDVIVRSLVSNPPHTNYPLLVGQAAALRERTESSWNAFIEGKLDRYFSHVRELEAVVEATLKAASEQMDALTKALTDSALAAVGVIVASFLTAIFKDHFNPVVYQLGVGAYIIYLALFPCLIGLTASYLRFRALVQGLEERRQSFQQRLSAEEVDKIINKGFSSIEWRYWLWFWISAFIYLLLVFLLLWSISAVPDFVASGNQPAAANQLPAAAKPVSVPPSNQSQPVPTTAPPPPLPPGSPP